MARRAGVGSKIERCTERNNGIIPATKAIFVTCPTAAVASRVASTSLYRRRGASGSDPRAQRHLHSISAVTDSRIGHLDVDDLLGELLARVAEVLAADTAAVLLLDEASGQLEARSAFGIEEEVRQGVRVPLG